ncbi:DUF4260 domain-containing protein [Hyphomicrobium sp. CS1BSMeth3]|uniref:DUF4260 domain-containing protein n=1 Tax=Hyphomicrobium sp. CS1BSMeth3 TaxID=1892844 RepID=UPI000931268A|nr:DUF4260 domain-containing protein [Hyphomicrobium sp. CS1BSMeth3]
MSTAPERPHAVPAPTGAVRRTLQLEGAALAAAALVTYTHLGESWWLFALLLLAPDLSFAAYLAGPRVGAVVYNLVHSTIGPILLGTFAYLAGAIPAVAVALIWLFHIGTDRMLGYGLKYGTGFKDTHLGRIG